MMTDRLNWTMIFWCLVIIFGVVTSDKVEPSPTRAIILDAVQEATLFLKTKGLEGMYLLTEDSRMLEKFFQPCTDEVSTYTSDEKSAFLAKRIKLLVTNVKDEPNIAEFVVHHLLLGFDHVIVLDDHSGVVLDPVKEIADPELWERVTVLKICSTKQHKATNMNVMASAAAKLNASWYMYLDGDEHLTFPSLDTSLQTWLDGFPAETERISFNWLQYGSSYHEELPPNTLFAESYVYHDQNVHPCIKCMVKILPGKIWKLANNPHSFVYDGVDEKKSLYNALGVPGLLKWDAFGDFKTAADLMSSDGRIIGPVLVHMYYQSRFNCLRRKGLRRRDDGQGFRVKVDRNSSLSAFDSLCNHDYANKVLDKDTYGKYAPRIRAALAFKDE